MPTRLLLRHRFGLGDAVLLTALCRDIQLAYPGQFELILDANYRELFDNNPYARVMRSDEPAVSRRLDIRYKAGIRASNRGERVHMLAWYHRDFQTHTGLTVPLTRAGGDLHLTAAELRPTVQGRYWVVMAGGKADATVKIWRQRYWQQTVDRLATAGIQCVQAGAVGASHIHHKLTNVVDMVGKCKGAREFCSLLANAEGVICPITGAMHIAAALNKPAVVIAGGREAAWWEHYTPRYNAFPSTTILPIEHRFLHTIGELDCCRTAGCWKHRTVVLPDGQQGYNSPSQLCRLPVISDSTAAPQCMDNIKPEAVVAAVLSYYNQESLPDLSDTLPIVVTSPPVQSAEPPVTDTDYVPLPTLPLILPRPAGPVCRGIDHPLIGGKFTVFVLVYGDYLELITACFKSILATIATDKIDLRIGMSAVTPRVRQYIQSLPASKVYDAPDNPGKYVVMRRMFHDPLHPIDTRWFVWFDDDTRIIDSSMWSKLCDTITNGWTAGVRLIGWPMSHDLQQYAKNGHDPYRWFKAASWWRGRHLRLKGRETLAANGSTVAFVPGWWWAMNTEAMRRADVPDTRLIHNGDIAIGEQINQQGWKIGSLNTLKSLVWTPPREAGGRRNAAKNKPFPWAAV